MSYLQAFQAFMAKSFQPACDLSTRASLVNIGYSVELLENGTYRVFRDSPIETETKNDSSGIILSLPVLEEEWVCEDPFFSFYDDAEQSIREAFIQKMVDIAKQKESYNPRINLPQQEDI